MRGNQLKRTADELVLIDQEYARAKQRNTDEQTAIIRLVEAEFCSYTAHFAKSRWGPAYSNIHMKLTVIDENISFHIQGLDNGTLVSIQYYNEYAGAYDVLNDCFSFSGVPTRTIRLLTSFEHDLRRLLRYATVEWLRYIDECPIVTRVTTRVLWWISKELPGCWADVIEGNLIKII
jgi:hypothetical protein